MIINIEVPNEILIEHFRDTLDRIGQVCLRDYYGNPKSIRVNKDIVASIIQESMTSESQQEPERPLLYYTINGAYKVIEDDSKYLEQCSIVTVSVGELAYREKLHDYWVKGKKTVKLDDFLNGTAENNLDDINNVIADGYPKYFVELTFKIPYGGKNYYSKFWSNPIGLKQGLPEATRIVMEHDMVEGLSNPDYPELIQLGDDEDFNDIFDVQLYKDKDCEVSSNIIAHCSLHSMSNYVVKSELHKSLLVMLKGYDGSWFPSNGITKLNNEDLEYILRNYPKIDSSFKKTFDIMANENTYGPARVEKFIKHQKEIMMTDSKYYVEEMTGFTEDDGKIYADPALISDLIFY